MLKRTAVVCLVFMATLLLAGQTAPKKRLSVRDQVNQALGGKVIRVEPNNTFPDDSLVQRITLVVDRKGVQSRATMEYFIDENLNILKRRLYGANNAVLWSLETPTMSEEERIAGWNNCIEECKRAYPRGRSGRRHRGYILCAGSCDLIYMPDSPQK
jgi:hypothetical protein